MDQEGFRQYLQKRQQSEEQIAAHFAIIQQFEAFIAATRQPPSSMPPSAAEVQAFTARLAQAQQDDYDHLVALARFGYFTHNRPVYLAMLELLDGGEAMENLYHRLAETVGEPTRDAIFSGLPLPTFGVPLPERSRLTQIVMERMQERIDADSCRKILSPSLRDLRSEWYLEERQKYQDAEDFDAYLEAKRREFIQQLQKIKEEGGLFFNQEITDEVIEFVRSDPEISQGVRRGNTLYVTKIPYMTKEYLQETDPDRRRYYACHCPWARESLRPGEKTVSSAFCQCSAGFHKKPWEVIFDQTLEFEVLESVLAGDLRCRFAIHLPEQLRSNA